MVIDNTLIVGIMTSVVTLIAAFITVSSAKKANENREDTDKYSIFNKNYTVLLRRSDNNIVIVKDGFSWPALLFHVFWVLYSKLWEVIFTILLLFGGLFIHLYVVDYVSNSNFVDYYMIGINSMLPFIVVTLGIFGNRLIIRKYTHSFCLIDNRNHEVVGSVVATTKSNALLKYMEKEGDG